MATMQTKDQPRRGRKSDYHAEIAETICNRLVNGESLRAICADPAMPARATVFRWLASNQEFRRSYALARECQAEDMVRDPGHRRRQQPRLRQKHRSRWQSDLGRGSRAPRALPPQDFDPQKAPGPDGPSKVRQVQTRGRSPSPLNRLKSFCIPSTRVPRNPLKSGSLAKTTTELAGQPVSFGTRGSQVQILPLRPILS
jgi:hypothetical protein